MFLTLLAAWAADPTLEAVERALEAAESAPSDASTRAANDAANAYRRAVDSELAHVLETYSLILRFPYDSSEISYSLHDAGLAKQAWKNRKHPMAPRAVCAARDLFRANDRSAKADEFDALAGRMHASCGAPRSWAKVAPREGIEAALVDAMKAKEDALRASAHIDPETRAELDALQDSLDAKQAAAQGAVLDAMSGYAEAKAADEAARAELANALRANSRAGCDDATPAPAARIEACSPWVDAHPTDAAGLFFLVEAHMALAQAGTDAAENARRAIARLEQLRPLLPDQATSIDDAIAGLRPLVE